MKNVEGLYWLIGVCVVTFLICTTIVACYLIWKKEG